MARGVEEPENEPERVLELILKKFTVSEDLPHPSPER
jgi:hypothetical protein